MPPLMLVQTDEQIYQTFIQTQLFRVLPSLFLLTIYLIIGPTFFRPILWVFRQL